MDQTAYADGYINYLVRLTNDSIADIELITKQIIAQTRWDSPDSGTDWNNTGVMALL